MRRLHDGLREQGRETWVDWVGIPPATDWLREVYEAIASADTFVFVISSDSVVSKTCRAELTRAVRDHKRLVPVLCHEVPARSVPKALRELNWIDFRDEAAFEPSLTLLLSAVDTDLDWVRGHTRFLLRALEWQRSEHDSGLLMRGAELGDAVAWISGAAGHEPAPAPLHAEFVQRSQEAESAERTRLEELRDRAVGRQLASQAAQLLAEAPRHVDRALLLAAESVRRSPSVESAAVLRQLLALVPGEVTMADVDRAHGEVVALATWSGLLALGTTGGLVRVRDLRSDDARDLRTGGPIVSAVEFTTDGSGVVVADESGVATCFPVEGGEPLWSVGEHGYWRVAAVSPGARLYVAGNDSERLVVWDLERGDPVAEFPEPAYCAAFSVDGTRLLTGTLEGGITVRSMDKWEIEGNFRQDDLVSRVAAGPAARAVLTTDSNGNIRLWADEQEVARFVGEGRTDVAGEGAAFSIDGTLAAVGGSVGRVIAVESRRELARVPRRGRACAFASDARLFAFGGAVVDTGSVGEGWVLAHGEPVSTLAVAPTGDFVAAGGENGAVSIWSLPDAGTPVRATTSARVSALLFTADGQQLAAESNSEVAAIESATGRVLKGRGSVARAGVSLEPAAQLRAKIRPDEVFGRSTANAIDKFSATVRDGSAYVEDARTGREVEPARAQGTRAVAFSPDGRYVALGGDGRELNVWDVALLTAEAPPPRRRGRAGRFESQSLIFCGDLESWVFALAFSPDSRHVAVGTVDGGAHVWEVATGVEVARVVVGAEVRDVIFSEDGTRLWLGDEDGIVQCRLWRSGDLVAEAERRAGRRLTRQEWGAALDDEPYPASHGH